MVGTGMMAFMILSLKSRMRRTWTTDSLRYKTGSQGTNSRRDTYSRKRVFVRSNREYARESLVYRTAPRYLEYLMVEGRTGSKLAMSVLKSPMAQNGC